MKDNIIFKKMWEDDTLMQLNVVCSSPVAMASTMIYVNNFLIDELICQINQFLDGTVEASSWANEHRGDGSTACVSFRFCKKDTLGHINIEVYAELDDGGTYTDHNCCFFVETEYGLLMDFCKKLLNLKTFPARYQVQLCYS